MQSRSHREHDIAELTSNPLWSEEHPRNDLIVGNAEQQDMARELQPAWVSRNNWLDGANGQMVILRTSFKTIQVAEHIEQI